MKIARNCLFVLVGCSLLAWAGSAMAQIVPPGASQRDCQTIRTCNFARGGSYRGCLSSYRAGSAGSFVPPAPSMARARRARR